MDGSAEDQLQVIPAAYSRCLAALLDEITGDYARGSGVINTIGPANLFHLVPILRWRLRDQEDPRMLQHAQGLLEGMGEIQVGPGFQPEGHPDYNDRFKLPYRFWYHNYICRWKAGVCRSKSIMMKWVAGGPWRECTAATTGSFLE